MHGWIGFTKRRRHFLHRVVCWFLDSDWSHTFLIFEGDGEMKVLEADESYVRIGPLSKYLRASYTNTFFKPIGREITKDKVDKALDMCAGYVGEKYGWLQLLGIAITWPLKKLGLKADNPIGKGYICSEIVYMYLRSMGQEPDIDKDSVTPVELYDYLKDKENFKEEVCPLG